MGKILFSIIIISIFIIAGLAYKPNIEKIKKGIKEENEEDKIDLILSKLNIIIFILLLPYIWKIIKIIFFGITLKDLLF